MCSSDLAIRDGDVWYAKIRVNDGEVDSDWFTTQNVTIGSDNSPPTMVSVSISGGPFTTVDDIQATAQGDDVDGDVLTYEWDWPNAMGAVSSSTLPSFYTENSFLCCLYIYWNYHCYWFCRLSI